ncbi:MAG: hypothetical protein WCK42_05580 [Myxococcaceae bacterium]
MADFYNSPKSRIMVSGAGRPNPCTVKEIGEWMQIKPSSVTQALSKFRKQKIG